MKIIGLTGSIGMGKSVTANLFRSLGVPVFDSDSYVHELLQGAAVEPISKIFPASFDKKHKRIDRQALGKIVFADAEAKKTLEQILHPLIWGAQQKFLTHHKKLKAPYVVLDIPLLFETGRDQICDITVCVTAPAFLQKNRVMARPHMTEEKFAAIIKSQMPDAQKRMLADIVIPTGAGKAFTLQKIKKLLDSGHA